MATCVFLGDGVVGNLYQVCPTADTLIVLAEPTGYIELYPGEMFVLLEVQTSRQPERTEHQ